MDALRVVANHAKVSEVELTRAIAPHLEGRRRSLTGGTLVDLKVGAGGRSMSSFFCDVETHVSSPIVLRPLDRRVFRPPPLITDSEPALPTSRVQFKRSPIRSPTRSAVPPW